MSINDNTDISLLNDNNFAEININRNTKANSNFDEIMISKDNNNDICKNDPMTNIEKLF